MDWRPLLPYPKDNVNDLLSRREISNFQIITVAEVGSTAHGISVAEQDDQDYTVVRWETWEEMITGSPKRQSMMIRTQPDGVRSRFGDIDLNVYTLRKFTGLAAKGNPSILTVLFVPTYHVDPKVDIIQLRDKVASKLAGAAFLGYMRQQMERWLGVRGQKNVTRPELVEAYGFDTKYAAHIIRLGYQGIVYLSDGYIPVPLPDWLAEEIRDLRTGEVEEYDALAWAKSVENDLKKALDKSKLPDKPAMAGVDRWLHEQYANWFEVKL